jgi:O-antigen ligase
MSIAIVMALIISIINGYIFWCVSTSFLLLLSLYFLEKKVCINLLSVVIYSFLLLLTLNLIFIRPINNADAGYLIWFLVSGYVLFLFASKHFIKNTFYLLVGVMLILSIWGNIQYLTGYGYLVEVGNRANAIFFTPNSFAASINIILLPLIILYLLGKEKKYLLTSILILFSALLVTQSRGGWVSFLSSLIFISILMKVLSVNFNPINFKKLVIGLCLVLTIYGVIEFSEFNLMNKSKNINDGNLIRSETIVSTLSHRWELYRIAWQNIKEKPLVGHGFHTYQYFQMRDQKPPHLGNVTRFAHNDYLQLWMEAGVLGVILFVTIFIVLIHSLVVCVKKISRNDTCILISVIAGIGSFYVHALVDFVFYTPFILLMFASSLGVFNRIVSKYQKSHVLNIYSKHMNFNLMKSLMALIGISLLSQPAIAHLSYDEAVRRTHRLDFEGALPYYELARRFAIYEPGYYWYEGAVWMNAVRAGEYKESAILADELFSRGMEASPFAVNNRLARAELHRDYGYLLDKQASLETVLSWNEQALVWRPNDPLVRMEHLKTLVAIGNIDRVNQLVDIYIQESPDSQNLIEFKESL